MKPYLANLINAVVLIGMGLWGYLASSDSSPTALIPVAFGFVFAAATPLFRRGNKVVAHIVVVFTFLLIIALYVPMKGAVERDDSLAMFRVGFMMLCCLLALIVYIKSFVDARRNPA